MYYIYKVMYRKKEEGYFLCPWKDLLNPPLKEVPLSPTVSLPSLSLSTLAANPLPKS